MENALLAFDWTEALQVLGAMLLGGLLGFEREWRGRAAGLRTNMLIAMAACLFTIMSINWFPIEGSTRDTARMAAQIVSGVGFIGAGMTFRTDDGVRGLTTAATIWIVAAIGIAVGVGAYFLAAFTTLLSVFVLRVLKPVNEAVPPEAEDA